MCTLSVFPSLLATSASQQFSLMERGPRGTMRLHNMPWFYSLYLATSPSHAHMLWIRPRTETGTRLLLPYRGQGSLSYQRPNPDVDPHISADEGLILCENSAPVFVGLIWLRSCSVCVHPKPSFISSGGTSGNGWLEGLCSNPRRVSI
jgi:hypothetical protein